MEQKSGQNDSGGGVGKELQKYLVKTALFLQRPEMVGLSLINSILSVKMELVFYQFE